MTDLNTDPRIEANSPLPADTLHAIGVIAFRWGRCELGLFLLLAAVAKLPRRDVWAMTHDLGDVSICDKIHTFALRQGYHPDGLALIKNGLALYDRCRQNRNTVVHAWTFSSSLDPPLVRRSRKAIDPEPTPFPSSRTDLRRVADDIGGLATRLWFLDCLLEERGLDAPIASPGILPLSEILWTPPQSSRKERPRPLRPSRP